MMHGIFIINGNWFTFHKNLMFTKKNFIKDLFADHEMFGK